MSTEEQEHKIDRKGWPVGPWDNEPDKVQFKTRAGFAGMIIRNGSGALCGYVGVPRGHWAYEQDEGDVDPQLAGDGVHGGLTYASKCAGHICHVPEPGEPDDVWWLGFDCNHAFDATPRYGNHPVLRQHETYRTLDYVRAQVEHLAEQLNIPADPVQD